MSDRSEEQLPAEQSGGSEAVSAPTAGDPAPGSGRSAVPDSGADDSPAVTIEDALVSLPEGLEGRPSDELFSQPYADDDAMGLASDPDLTRAALSAAEAAFDATEPGVSAPKSRRPVPASTKTVQADPLIGLVVADRYRILSLVGRGGMGIVYCVEHTRIGKLLAMKLLAGELSANKEVVRRFKQEALTVSKLSSPHTVQVFDYGVWQHMTYLVMEYVEGRDLGRVLRREGPMQFVRLGKLMVQVCASLVEAHAKGIVHRDIKPENIMVVADRGGTEMCKVLDFGLAKLREGQELNEVTTQGAVIGTPYYISPEQVMGEAVDGRTDIYSLGGVMFRALTGTYPFNAGSPMGMFTKHLTEAPPSVASRAPELHVPPGVSELVLKCLQKSAAARFQSVEELRGALLLELESLGLGSSDRLLLGDSQTREARSWNDEGLAPARSPLPIRRDRLGQSQIATRDELAAYERKLRRKRTGLWLGLALLPVGGASAGAYAVVRAGGQAFSGEEREPNDQAATATPIPLGAEVRGHVGRRIDGDTGDRDFYAFDVLFEPPSDGSPSPGLALRLSALPNMATCVLLYGDSSADPVAQFCSGRAGQDLVVPAWRVAPGRFYAVVLQDRAPYGGRPPFVHENVSDAYRLSVAVALPEPEAEIEPNDVLGSAVRLAPGEAMAGAIGWVGDEDFFCAAQGVGRALTWQVEDPSRRPGTTLEVTPLATVEASLEAGPLVRLHGSARSPVARARLEADQASPWQSPPAPAAAERCIRLRLATDPWGETRDLPLSDPGPYVVRLVEVDPR